MGRGVKSWLFGFIALLLAALLLFSGWQVFVALKAYRKEDALK